MSTSEDMQHASREQAPATASPAAGAADLWTSPRFGELLSLLADHGVLRAEFDQLEMPEGHSPDEVWAALTAIRRSQAVHYWDISYIDGQPLDEWYSPTHRLQHIWHELELRTCEGSRLDKALGERHSRRLIVDVLVEEVVATAHCDGLEIDEASARGLVTGEQSPATPVEHLVVNMYGVLMDLLDKELPPITPELIQTMYDRLTANIDTTTFTSQLAWGCEWPEDPVSHDEAIRQLCGMASGEIANPADHLMVVSQRLICKFWKTTPYPSCNYTMGSLLSRLHMKRSGYPAFVYLPTASATLAWKHNHYTAQGVAPYEQSGNVCGLSRDWTVYQESSLQLILDELNHLEQRIFRLKEQDDALLAHLAGDHSFNHRQRDLLRRAVLVPESAFRIEEHRAKWDLAYSTARQDLGALVKRGLLEMHYDGKAQVFGPRHDMKAVLARLYPSE